MRIVVEIPDHLGMSVGWIGAAVLDAVETGASRHCLEMLWDGDRFIGLRHHRLGVSVITQPEEAR